MYLSINQIANQLILEDLLLEGKQGPGIITMNTGIEIPYAYIEATRGILVVGVNQGSFKKRLSLQTTRMGTRVTHQKPFCLAIKRQPNRLAADHGPQKAAELISWARREIQASKHTGQKRTPFDNELIEVHYKLWNLKKTLVAKMIRDDLQKQHQGIANDDYDIDDTGDVWGTTKPDTTEQERRLDADPPPELQKLIDQESELKRKVEEYKAQNQHPDPSINSNIDKANEILNAASGYGFWELTMGFEHVLTMNPANVASIT